MKKKKTKSQVVSYFRRQRVICQITFFTSRLENLMMLLVMQMFWPRQTLNLFKKRKSIKAQRVIQKNAYKTFFSDYFFLMKAALVTT